MLVKIIYNYLLVLCFKNRFPADLHFIVVNYLMPLQCAKTVTMVNFMLYTYYHNE